MNYALGENGKISDNDNIFVLIDKWHEDGEFEKIVEAVKAVPKKLRSVNLRFRLISACNNLKRFEEAIKELDAVYPECKTPEQKAKYCYMCGYIFDVNGREMMAVHCYKMGIEEDPDDKSGLNLEKEITDCLKYIDKELTELKELSGHIAEEIKKACAEIPDDDKESVTDEKFAMYLGYFAGIYVMPNFKHGLGFRNFYKKYGGKEKKLAFEHLEKLGITNKKSFWDFYYNDRIVNLEEIYSDIPPYLDGTLPESELSELDKKGKENFLNGAEFYKSFYKLLPEAGILAFDICEKVAVLRYAYSCDILKKDDYDGAVTDLIKLAREKFSSFEEYLISLIFGYGTYIFHFDDWNISGAVKFMDGMLPLLLEGDLPRIKWKAAE